MGWGKVDGPACASGGLRDRPTSDGTSKRSGPGSRAARRLLLPLRGTAGVETYFQVRLGRRQVSREVGMRGKPSREEAWGKKGKQAGL